MVMLFQGQLSGTASAIVTVGVTEKIQAKTFLLYNNDSADIDVFFHFVPNASGALGTANNTNRVSLTVPTGKTVEFSPSYPVEYDSENDAIFASAATASMINCFVMGLRIDLS